MAEPRLSLICVLDLTDRDPRPAPARTAAERDTSAPRMCSDELPEPAPPAWPQDPPIPPTAAPPDPARSTRSTRARPPDLTPRSRNRLTARWSVRTPSDPAVPHREPNHGAGSPASDARHPTATAAEHNACRSAAATRSRTRRSEEHTSE